MGVSGQWNPFFKYLFQDGEEIFRRFSALIDYV